MNWDEELPERLTDEEKKRVKELIKNVDVVQIGSKRWTVEEAVLIAMFFMDFTRRSAIEYVAIARGTVKSDVLG